MSRPESERLLAKQARRESNARTYPRHLPLAIEQAEVVRVEDVDGTEYYDCLAGAGTLALGHNHPVVVQAIEEVLDASGPLHTLDITTPTKDAFVDELFESLPDEFADSARVQFCSPAGTDAIEWIGPDNATTLVGNNSAMAGNKVIINPDSDEFAISPIKDTDRSRPVLNSQDDRLRLTVPAHLITDGAGLSEGQTAEVKITTQYGATTVYQVAIPQSLSQKKAVTV
jgi:archaellin